ncbi:hypothetical protein ACFVEN_44110 [Streptomyces sp. NPDC057681]|uniref:hypothetical protein n=1 Tax=Streptomyces sp. NPDC057681 TaxID=3346209 RepID=UPI00367A0AB3
MTSDIPSTVPAWPRYRLTAGTDDSVTVEGPAASPGPYPGRAEAIEAVARLAARLRPPRAVLADAIDTDGTLWPLAIGPDSTATEAGPPQRFKKPKAKRAEKTPKPTKARARTAPAPAPMPQPQASQPLPQPRPPAWPMPAGPLADAPTTRVRIRRATPVTEQHERPVESAGTPAPPAPRAAEAPPAAPPTPQRAVPAPADCERDPIPGILRIRALAEAGQYAQAAAMAAAFDEGAARAHGPSHPKALEAREVRAHIAAESGDVPAAVSLYRDVAERWALQNAHQAAGEAAGRAHALWLRIDDTAQAITCGEIVLRMRQAIPGPGEKAYRQAAARLTQLRDATEGASQTRR